MRQLRSHRWIFPGLFSGVVLLGGAQMALAQNLPTNIRTASSAQQYTPQIDAFVAGQVTKLKTQGTERAGRDALSAPLVGGPTQSFLDVYAASINTQLKPLAASKEMRVRLNAAVVNADVARRANNFYQAEVTLLFVRDKSDSVVIWGLKAAKYEIPAQLLAQSVLRKPNLVPEIVPAVKAHGAAGGLNDGPIAEEAYAALTLSPEGSEAFVKNAQAGGIKDLLPEVYTLLEYRIGLYAAGAAPPAPTAENAAALFLLKGKVWAVESPQQQQRTQKDLADLLAGVVSVWAAIPSGSRDELVVLTRQTGKAFQVIADNTANTALLNAAKALDKTADATDPADLQKMIDAIRTTLPQG